MEAHKISKIVESRFQKISSLADKIIAGFEIEDIHELRVEFKKLRAFIRLLRIELPGQRELRLPDRLKIFYHYTGNIRNLQLQEQRIRQSLQPAENPEEYLQFLANEQKNFKTKARWTAGNSFVEEQEL